VLDVPSNDELAEEATWIWKNIFAKNHPNSEIISKKIQQVLYLF
jgi:hypothetical protein